MGQFSRQSWWQIRWFRDLLLWGSSLWKELCCSHGQTPDANVDANNNVEHDADAVDNDGGNNNANNNDNDDGKDNNKKDSDDDNCCFDSNDAFFFVSEPLLMDLHFMTTFVGVTIEIDGLHRLSSTGV